MCSKCYISWIVFLQCSNIVSNLFQRGSLSLDKYLISFFISNPIQNKMMLEHKEVLLSLYSPKSLDLAVLCSFFFIMKMLIKLCNNNN